LFGWLIIFILLAAITKRAMYPYCVWLPEAMAAPTPVSSLVHSRTLVTAGVFLILRFYSLVGGLELELITIFGRFTLLISGLGAMYCIDYKKVVALSTLSQLAFIIISIGVGAPSIALFHLLTHALFKSSLFISVGGFIHFSRRNQDPRHRGRYLNS
jgi:NADH:ubiquinone oxidoreductase subunit 5 (subunit L)/multisubunit Na+/H+ antiporter MnhA subunit